LLLDPRTCGIVRRKSELPMAAVPALMGVAVSASGLFGCHSSLSLGV